MNQLYNFTSIQIIIALVLLMMTAAELGYRRGRKRALRSNASISTSRAIIKSALLAMVGLLLAFSYNMSANRYELRYSIVLKEANAMGTCWLRTGFLPEMPRGQARTLLRELVDVRLEHVRLATNQAGYDRTNLEMDRIQNQIWSVVEQAFNGSSEPVRLIPLVQAVNEMIDISGERKAADWNHVPAPVVVGLMICIVIASFLVGHSSGEAELRDWLMWSLFLALIAMVFYIMLDLDRPEHGLIQLNPAPLLDLQQTMQNAPPSTLREN